MTEKIQKVFSVLLLDNQDRMILTLSENPWQLFIDLQRYNPYTREMRTRLHQSLDRVLELLESSLDMPMGDDYHKS